MTDNHTSIAVQANCEIPMGKHRGTLHFGADSFDTEVSATLCFRPRPRLVLKGQFVPKRHWLGLVGQFFGDRSAELQLEGSSERKKLLIKTLKAGVPATFEASLQGGYLTRGQENDCSRIVFHLINFPDFIVQRDGKAWQNLLALNDDKFQTAISPVADSEVTYRTLKEQGGYGVTHVATMTRSDGGRIEFSQAQAELHKLHTYLSFARGSWTGVIAANGLNHDGEIIWSEWSERLVSEWKSSTSWWDRHNAQALETGYCGFSARWNEEYWKEVINTAVYWYIRSNGAGAGAGIDGGIILTQAALEKVAWARLVDEWESLSGEGFGRLYSSDQLRLLLSRMRVPLGIPSAMTSLVDLGKSLNWDAPRLFTECRNQLVHPSEGKWARGKLLPYFEVWNLGQWYLELALLHICGFDDVYSDRTKLGGWIGDVRQVPWSVTA